MAITDNSFTADELTGALTANPALLENVRGVLTAQKLVVRNETEEQEFRTRHEADIAGRLTSAHATGIEKDILDITGVPKKAADEKYTDYLKRVLGDSKTSITRLEKEIADIKAKGGTTQLDLDRIKQLEKAITDKETDHTEKLTAAEKKVIAAKAEGKIEAGAAAIRSKYNPLIPKKAMEIAESTAVAKLTGMAQFNSENKLVFVGEDGKIICDSNLIPLTAAELLETEMKDFFIEEKKRPGGGTAADPAKPGDDAPFKMTAGIKTQVQLTDALLAKGLSPMSKEYGEIWKAEAHKLPLR